MTGGASYSADDMRKLGNDVARQTSKLIRASAAEVLRRMGRGQTDSRVARALKLAAAAIAALPTVEGIDLKLAPPGALRVCDHPGAPPRAH